MCSAGRADRACGAAKVSRGGEVEVAGAGFGSEYGVAGAGVLQLRTFKF